MKALPDDGDSLYSEARNSVAAGAHTASVLTCRKLLMNVAVGLGADVGKGFMEYVEYLANKAICLAFRDWFVDSAARNWFRRLRLLVN